MKLDEQAVVKVCERLRRIRGEAGQLQLFRPDEGKVRADEVALDAAIYIVESFGRVLARKQAGVVRKDATDSERRAAVNVKVGSQRGRILACLHADVTCSTAWALGPKVGISPNQAATRLGELRAIGFVSWTGSPGSGESIDSDGFAIRATTPGNTARVHILTPLGLAWLAETAGVA